MKRPPRVVQRKGSSKWYFRAKIPADLREHYGKNEIVFSLRTSDLREAIRKERLESLKLDQEFLDARRYIKTEVRTTLTELEIERLSALWYHQLMEEDEEGRFQGDWVHDPPPEHKGPGMPEAERSQQTETHDFLDAYLSHAYA